MSGGQLSFRETIFAPASGKLPSGVAIVRVSGPGVREALARMIGRVPEERRAHYGPIMNGAGTVLDRGVTLFFAGPRSFTGEDTAEFHLHGGRAVVAAVLECLSGIAGFRPAEAGEFTRRAFLLGRMDLTGVEALGDLIEAETEAQRRFALENAAGKQGTLYAAWRRRIIEARALVEAELDFSDEADVTAAGPAAAFADMALLAAEMERHLESYHRAEMIRDGFRVVIIGAPNAGKSSLLNALARRDAAIVSDEPGTTRDLIEVALDLDGAKVIITDTAGIRAGPGKVEAIGIARAAERARGADLVLLMTDLSDPRPLTPDPDWVQVLRVGSKADLLPAGASVQPGIDCAVSAHTGAGIAALLARLSAFAGRATESRGEVMPSRLRHVDLLRSSLRHLLAAGEQAAVDLELRAEELRLAGDALGRITGAIDVEDLLDAIFSRFCIGK